MPGPLGTQIVTDFDGPDESPLSEDGTWSQLSPTQYPLARKNNVAVISVSDPIVNYSYYNQQLLLITGEGRGEAWGCSEGGQLGAALETWRVFLFLNPGTSFSGYLFYFGGALSKDFVIRRYTNGVPAADIASNPFIAYPARMALVIDGDAVQGWCSFDPFPDIWQLICQTNDTTYRGAFFAGLGLEDPTSGSSTPSLGFDCFGLGVPNRQQFFRWLYN